ncbi:MAG: hypothetical protein QF489_03020 [Planctomycetota bacterium]|nr:hypothetical protein [Planctomycetota bacterium]
MSTASARRRGAALLVVLMSLAVLFSLGVPFLFASRMRSEAASETYDRSRARIAVDSASRVTAFHEALTHPSIDPTPLWDSTDEWDGSMLGALPHSLGEDWQGSTEAWGAEIQSVQATVSLATAPVMLLQNLIHPCFLTADASHGDSELQVTSTDGFPESGMLWIGARWVVYGGIEARKFTEVQQDLEAPEDLDQIRFRRGREVQDPRVQALALSRFQTGRHHAPEFFGDMLNFNFGTADAETLPEADKSRIQSFASLDTGSYGSAEWEPGGWLTRAVNPENPEIISISDGSLYNAGTVIRIIPEDGDLSDAVDRLVMVAFNNRLLLSAPVPTWFVPFQTRVHPLRREPIDINACKPEVLNAMVTGLAFLGNPPVVSDRQTSGSRGREWVSETEARAFTERVMAARPLQGPADLWARVLAPMADEGSLTDIDAWAIYVNGIDPNNGSLRQSTTSFGYRSGNLYQHRINAAIRSRLGRTLARASYEQRVHAVPSAISDPAISLLNSQEVFEDFGRWSRGLHGVTTLPNAMGSFTTDFGQPLNGPTLQVGALTRPGRSLPETDHEISAIVPVPARESDSFPHDGRGRTEHFDYETSPLGRDINEFGPYNEPLNDWGVGDDNAISNAEPLHFQGWFRADNLTNGHIFDLAGFETDRNRVSVAIENNELIVRCWSTTGEDPGDPFSLQEAITQRLDFAEYALTNRWFHISVTLRNQSARGMQVCIDGVPRGEIDGFTHLTQAMDAWTASAGGEIYVESTDGFPDRGVLRIGNELIDYSSKTSNSFVLDWDPTLFLGGRSLREATDLLALATGTEHPMGAGVELYGYSTVILERLPPGGHTLSGDVGPWSIATCTTGIDEIIALIPPLLFPIGLGQGISGDYLGPIELSPLMRFDAEDEYYAEAFQSDGGYAFMFQGPLALRNAEDESRIGGWEVVRYSSRVGTTLTLAERNVQTPGVVEATDGVFNEAGNTFVTNWEDNLQLADGRMLGDIHQLDVYIVPISMKTSGATDVTYMPGLPNRSEVVQIAAPGDPANTEWVRYDNIIDGCFVRDDWGALYRMQEGLVWDDEEDDIEPPAEPPSPSGPDAPEAPDSPDGPIVVSPALYEIPAPPAMQQQDPEDIWASRPTIGNPEEGRDTDAAGYTIWQRSWLLQFRGVMGTYDHPHSAGDRAVPVFKTIRPFSGAQAVNSIPGEGYVGRLDRVAVMDPTSPNSNLWYTVQWATAVRENDGRLESRCTYVAFEDSTYNPVTSYDYQTLVQEPLFYSDWREFPRLSKFPNHERPANLANFIVGGDTSGAAAEFSGIVDEVSLHNVGGMGNVLGPFARGAMILEMDFDATYAGNITVNASQLSLDGRRWNTPGVPQGTYLGFMPQSGILDIDGERIAYNAIDVSNGEITIAPDGRGLMGTEARGHGRGTRVWMVDGRASVALNGGMGVGSENVPLSDTNGFATTGMILIGQELMHAPMRGPGFVGMPRTRDNDDDDPGTGLLRGRFGTDIANHADGSVAISFPNRWMDNYIPRSDSGVGAWFQVSFEEPEAHWQSMFYQAELPDNSITVRALVRAGLAHWEDDPRTTPGLLEFHRGRTASGGPQSLELNSDRLDARFMFDWGPGAFDPTTYTATGWTMEPRLRNIMFNYWATTRVENSKEVVE